MTTPTQRTLDHCRRQGLFADVCERWIDPVKVRKDLFGFGDVVCIRKQIVLIQATTGANCAARVYKIRDQCTDAAIAWLLAGGAIEVWGWTKYAKPVQRRWWRPRIVEVTLADFPEVDQVAQLDTETDAQAELQGIAGW